MSAADSPFAYSTMQGLFVTPLWIFDLPTERAGPLNARLRKELERLLAPLPDIPVGGNWQSEQKLHRVPEFEELMALAHAAGGSVVEALDLDDPPPLEITGCWANISPRGASHRAHVHPNNFLSGVYYLKVPPGSGFISFNDPRPQVMQISPRMSASTPLNSNMQSVPVEEGRMVVFPSWLPHAVPPNPHEDVRISVSFNLMFRDFTERMSRPLWSGLPLKGVD